jgi:hypothetical protein
MNAVNEIKEQLYLLPEKDKILCEKFLENRQFESILEIVESDIIKMERSSEKKRRKNSGVFKDLDRLANLEELKISLLEYIDQLTYNPNDEEF